MLYKIISLHGDLHKKTTNLAYVHIEENGGQWSSQCLHYKQTPIAFSSTIPQLLQTPVSSFITINNEVSNKLVIEINNFIKENQLQHKIDFIATNGITINDSITFDDNATIAALISLPIIGEFGKMNATLQGNTNIFAIANNILQIDANANDENKSIALALLGALRWREANNILQENTNATKSHIGGSIWLGVDA